MVSGFLAPWYLHTVMPEAAGLRHSTLSQMVLKNDQSARLAQIFARLGVLGSALERGVMRISTLAKSRFLRADWRADLTQNFSKIPCNTVIYREKWLPELEPNL